MVGVIARTFPPGQRMFSSPPEKKSLLVPQAAPWIIIALLAAISTISYLVRVNITAADPSLTHDVDLTEKELAALVSAFLLSYGICQFPAGVLADRFGPRRVLAGALLGWAAFTVLTAGVERYYLIPGLGVLGTLLVVRFLLGITVAPMYPAAARSILCWVPGRHRAVANAVVIAGVALGTAITPPIMTNLERVVGWRGALCITAIPALVMAAVWFVVGRDHGPELLPPKKIELESIGASFRRLCVGGALLRDRNLWFLTLSYALMGYVSYIFIFWFFRYLVKERGFSSLEGSWIATAPWLLTLFTMPLGGALSDRLVRRLGYPWGRRLVPLVGLVTAGALVVVGSRVENAYVAVGLFAVCEALVMAMEGVFWASMIEIAREHSGSGGGILNMGGNLGGLFSPITPVIAGQVGWVAALDVGAGIGIVAGLLWLCISPNPGPQLMDVETEIRNTKYEGRNSKQ
jgi:ACS family glucarate transporter-like MFS transporter